MKVNTCISGRRGIGVDETSQKIIDATMYLVRDKGYVAMTTKDIAKLADILGHSSINTTRIYIISTGIEHRRRMENMHLIL